MWYGSLLEMEQHGTEADMGHFVMSGRKVGQTYVINFCTKHYGNLDGNKLIIQIIQT